LLAPSRDPQSPGKCPGGLTIVRQQPELVNQGGTKLTRLHLAVLLLFTGTALGQSGMATVSSPDGNLAITFRTVSSFQPVPGGDAGPAPEPARNGGQLAYEASGGSIDASQGPALRQEAATRCGWFRSSLDGAVDNRCRQAVSRFATCSRPRSFISASRILNF
jgi:hypothetical protein